MGFPGGAVVENLPANAGDAGSSPGLGGSHIPRSSWARGPQLLSLRIWSLCSAKREATIMRGLRTAMKNGPHLPQLEKALAQKRRPTQTLINKLKKKIIKQFVIKNRIILVSQCWEDEWKGLNPIWAPSMPPPNPKGSHRTQFFKLLAYSEDKA